MTISLKKGEGLSLSKASPGLSEVMIGLGWDPVKKKGGFFGMGGGSADIDLDASAILFSADRKVLEIIYFGKLRSADGTVRHSGDNLTGQGDGDDEKIMIDLDRISSQVSSIAITVNSFRGQTFDEVDNAFCRLVDRKTDRELCQFKLDEKGRHTGVVMASLTRGVDGWSMKAIGAALNGRTAQDLAASAANLI